MHKRLCVVDMQTGSASYEYVAVLHPRGTVKLPDVKSGHKRGRLTGLRTDEAVLLNECHVHLRFD